MLKIVVLLSIFGIHDTCFQDSLIRVFSVTLDQFNVFLLHKKKLISLKQQQKIANICVLCIKKTKTR